PRWCRLIVWAAVAFAADGEGNGPFPGVFDHPPALQYRVALPGGRLNAATHSEWSSPLLVGDWVVVGSAAGQAMYALSRRDGTLVRTFPADASVESPAAVRGSKVVFSDSGGNTWCYDLDGTLVWRHDGNAPVLVAPTIDPDGKVAIVGNVDDLAVALDLSTGALVWQYQAKRDATRQAELSLFAAPRPAIVDGKVYLGFSSGTLVAVDLATGEEQWKRSVGEGRYPDLVSDPVVSGNDVYASGYFKPLVAVDLPTHNVRWRVDAGAARSPTLIDGADGSKVLIHPGSDGTLRAIATLTGAELWRWSSGTSGALTSPVVTPAGLVVGSSAGSIYLVDPATGDELWRWHEPYLLQGLSSEPAVEGRQLVFTSNAGFLYSLLAPLPSPSEPARRVRSPL
ncbi:MAG: PQQ-binding-like beta-propeller repeat protein, partial [Myxococcota bacterium]